MQQKAKPLKLQKSRLVFSSFDWPKLPQNGQKMGHKNLNNPEKSGPCRDRTDDPQIKSVSKEDESMPV